MAPSESGSISEHYRLSRVGRRRRKAHAAAWQFFHWFIGASWPSSVSRSNSASRRGRRRTKPPQHPRGKAIRHATGSEIVGRLAAGDEASIGVGSVVSAVGSRVHGLALLLFALPDALPLPIPSVSAIIGLPLVLISAHLIAFGDRSRLPKRIEAAQLPGPAVRAVARYLVPVLSRLEHLSRPRWRALVVHERLIGAVCLYLSIILFLPIPLMNTPSAASLVAIGLGMVQRDGVFIAAGFVGALLTTAALAGVLGLAGLILSDF